MIDVRTVPSLAAAVASAATDGDSQAEAIAHQAHLDLQVKRDAGAPSSLLAPASHNGT